MNLQPLGDRLIVEVLDEEELTVSGIVLPDTAKEKPQRGKVTAVGQGKLSGEGKRLALTVRVGDEVLFGKYSGSDIKINDEDFKVLRESDLLAKVVG